MTDIDFDELDRAVNSLIGAKPADAPAVASPSDTSTSVPVTSTQAPIPTSPSPAPAQPLAARRTSGRFMDVVHPSSDMRTTTPATVVAEPVVVAPVTTETQSHDMPDPLDFHTADTPVASPVDATVTPEASAPLETPFISDAKVEKRPLGAFSAPVLSEGATISPVETQPMQPAPVTEPVVAASTEAPAADAPKAEEPSDVDTPLPAELGDDLLSIESNETIARPVDTPAPVEQPVEQTPVISIAQQYTESPSTGDAPVTTSIFDTEAYKKPLAHPKKKSSGWLVVLWIALLLIVGAGAGAAVYFYVLPLL